jgi:hypothetical protein
MDREHSRSVPLASCPTLAALTIHGEYRALPTSIGGRAGYSRKA